MESARLKRSGCPIGASGVSFTRGEASCEIMSETLRFALVGALAFGAAGAIGGTFGDALFVGFGVTGLVGGAALGFLWGGASRAWRTSIAAGLGLFVGLFLPLFVVLVLWDPPYSTILVGVVGGAIAGAALAFGLPRSAGASRLRAAGTLALAGALGWGAGFSVLHATQDVSWNALRESMSQALWGAWTFGLASVVGGAALGAAVGTLRARSSKGDRHARERRHRGEEAG